MTVEKASIEQLTEIITLAIKSAWETFIKTNDISDQENWYKFCGRQVAQGIIGLEMFDFRMDELDAVMYFVDKWLDASKLKDNPATRAATAREIALQAIESAETTAATITSGFQQQIECLKNRILVLEAALKIEHDVVLESRFLYNEDQEPVVHYLRIQNKVGEECVTCRILGVENASST